jgi:hypothetical protein
MKITQCVGTKAPPPPPKRHGGVLQGLGKAAAPSIVLGVAIAFGSGCSATEGMKVHLFAPVIQGSHGADPADDGWYHPPESPGLGQGG